MLNNSEVLACGKSLVDLGDSQLEFNLIELSSFVSGTLMPTLKERKWKTAIIAHNPAQYSVARQYKVVADAYIEVNVFADDSAALGWINKPNSH